MTGTAETSLIIGVAGQDGRLLRKHLEANGQHVIGVGRPTQADTCDYLPVDIRNGESVKQLLTEHSPREIYYLAAQHGSSETMPIIGDADTTRASWETNVEGFANVVNAVESLALNSRVLLAASALIYAPGDDLIDESTPLRPDSTYGLTKAAAVRLAREYRQRGLFVHTAVLFPHESFLRPEQFVASRVIRTALRISEGSNETIFLGDPDAVVDWSLATDVVRALATMMSLAFPLEFIVSSGTHYRVGAFASSVCHHLGLDPTDHIAVEPRRLKRPSARRVGNPVLLSTCCDWPSGRPVDEFVQLLLAEFMGNGSRREGPANS